MPKYVMSAKCRLGALSQRSFRHIAQKSCAFEQLERINGCKVRHDDKIYALHRPNEE